MVAQCRLNQGLDLTQIPAADQVQVAALDQATAAHVAGVHLGQVQGRHQHGLALNDAVFHPHDVVGRRADLRLGQGHAQAQVEGVLAGQGVVHQVAVLVVVADQAVGEEALGVWCVEARGRRVYSPPVARRRLRFGDLTVEKCASS